MITLGDVISAQQMGELRMEKIEHPHRRPLVLFGGGSPALAKVVRRILAVKTSRKKSVRSVGAPAKPTVPGLCDA